MYQEDLFATTNTKLAATMLTFGAGLRDHLPLEWVEEYASKADYLANRLRPNYAHRTITFNFDETPFVLKPFIAAFKRKLEQNEEAFNKLIDKLNLDPGMKGMVLAAHSEAMASGCRDALDEREHLHHMMNQVQDRSKWISVRGDKHGRSARFGKLAKLELIVETLNNL